MTDNQETVIESVDWAERRKVRSAARRSSKFYRQPWFIASASAAALLVLLLLVEVATGFGKVHPGVTVAGIDIGGKRPAEARAVLESKLPQKASEPITVTHAEQNWTYPPEEIGLEFDYAASVREAMSVGRSGNLFSAVGGRFSAWFGGVEVPAYPQADEELLAKALNDIAAVTDTEARDAAVEMSGAKATVVPGADGVALKRDAVAQAMLDAYLSDTREVEAVVDIAKMEVTDEEAARAAELAERLTSAPVKVVHESRSWTFSGDDIGRWLTFKRSDDTSAGPAVVTASADASASGSPAGVRLNVAIDAERLSGSVIPKVGAEIGRKAVDARFKTANGKVTIIPSEDGIGPDVDSLAVSLTDVLIKDGEREVELRTTRSEPEITTEKARSMGIKERIATFTTTFDSGNRPRVANIHLLGGQLDGTLIPPGGTFSFNGSIGERTAAKGYQEANAIVNGKLVPSLGGGICQVATTLFNTVFESGLPVVERRNHSFYISSYPKGRDATVSWGGADFKFKNDTENWVLISVGYSSSSVTVALYGTDPGYRVTSSTSAFRPGAAFPTEESKDPLLAEGMRVIESAGIDGRSITVQRTVKKGDTVVRTDSFVSNYKPKTQIVRIGTKVASSKPATATPSR